MRYYAARIAAIAFFAVAAVGWVSGLEPLECGLRALQGAAALFVMALVAGKIVIRILADAAVRQDKGRDDPRGN